MRDPPDKRLPVSETVPPPSVWRYVHDTGPAIPFYLRRPIVLHPARNDASPLTRMGLFFSRPACGDDGEFMSSTLYQLSLI
jgi:hypothetical protein